MKYYTRLKLYKANNVVFDPATKQAWSYGWWKFVAIIDNKVVFNNYGYSTATRGHQRKVGDLLDSLGIKVDLYIKAPNGLQDLGAALEGYNWSINKLTDLVNKPGTHATKNEERLQEIKSLKKTRDWIWKIIKKREVSNEI
jgi:hypothetical protein